MNKVAIIPGIPQQSSEYDILVKTIEYLSLVPEPIYITWDNGVAEWISEAEGQLRGDYRAILGFCFGGVIAQYVRPQTPKIFCSIPELDSPRSRRQLDAVAASLDIVGLKWEEYDVLDAPQFDSGTYFITAENESRVFRNGVDWLVEKYDIRNHQHVVAQGDTHAVNTEPYCAKIREILGNLNIC